MIYKLSLNEDVYSKEHIDELVACIRSSISGYVDNLGPLSKDNSFEVIWDSALNQKVAVKITDEHDKYGLASLEFNIYIDGEEFGPMCYNSIEIASMETKDFILSKLHKKFMEPRSPKLEEATLADYTVGDPDNQRYIGNAQVIKVSDLPRIGEKFKAGIATAINKIGYEDGYMIYEVWVTEPGSLEGFAEFEYDTARWLFAIKNFNEALERDNSSEEDLNEFAYKIDDLKQFYNTATGIDKEKYPNFFAWYDAMTKDGKFKNSQITA